MNDVREPLQTMVNQLDINDGRLRTRASTKSNHEPLKYVKIKCNICNKFYRADYMKVSLIVN
jgi:hypothetical protein